MSDFPGFRQAAGLARRTREQPAQPHAMWLPRRVSLDKIHGFDCVGCNCPVKLRLRVRLAPSGHAWVDVVATTAAHVAFVR